MLLYNSLSQEKRKGMGGGEEILCWPSPALLGAYSFICGLVSMTLCLPSWKPYILLLNPPIALDPLQTLLFPGWPFDRGLMPLLGWWRGDGSPVLRPSLLSACLACQQESFLLQEGLGVFKKFDSQGLKSLPAVYFHKPFNFYTSSSPIFKISGPSHSGKEI